MGVLLDQTEAISPWIRKELELGKTLKSGARGASVHRVQEWLILREFGVGLDGDFGDVTSAAVREFQQAEGLQVDGVVGENTFGALTSPLRQTLTPIDPANKSFAELVLAHARAHLAEHPLEIGGQNRGPWVRLYMEGNEGTSWAWCAGFVTFIMKQAAQALDVAMPIAGSVSCDTLAAQADAAGRLVSERTIRRGDVSKNALPTASIFLVRRTDTDWTHTGFVTDFENDLFQTLEGNTNDEGHRDGYELCARRRGYKKKDFITL